MILAASMGPMPKIWVRAVPEASTSASMRPFRSAIFLSSVLRSRSTSEASRRRRRTEVPSCDRMPRRIRAARSAESVLATPPGRRSRRSPWRLPLAPGYARLPAPLASRRAGAAPQMRPHDLPAPAARCARRPAPLLRHRPGRFCGRYRSKAPAPAPRAWAARPPRTLRPPPASPPATPPGAYPEATGVLYRPTTLGEPSSCPAFSSDLKPERSCGKLARSRSSLVASSTAATATDALWGSTPISTFSCARTSAFRSDLRHHRRERRTFRVRGAHIPLLSHFARRAPAGRKPRTSQPTSRGRQEVRERSLKPVP